MMKRKNKLAAGLITASLLIGTCSVVFAEEASALSCGAAIADITPTIENGLLPVMQTFAGGSLGDFNYELNTVCDPLHVRALALSDGGKTALVVTYDLANVNTVPTAQLIAEHTGLPEDAIFVHATSNHSDYVYGISTEDKERYFNELVNNQTYAVVDEALSNMQEVTVNIGYADCYANRNRTVTYEMVNEDGSIEEISAEGINGEGPVDHTVTVISFENADKEPVAFIANYGLMNVLTMGSKTEDNSVAVQSDVGGYISTQFENKFDGAVALYLNGGCQDVNPVIHSALVSADPENGGPVLEWLNLDAARVSLRFIGNNIFDAAMEAYNASSDATGNGTIGFASDYTTATENAEAYKLGMLRIGDINVLAVTNRPYAADALEYKAQATAENLVVAALYCPVDGFSGRPADKEAATALMNQLVEEVE